LKKGIEDLKTINNKLKRSFQEQMKKLHNI